MKQCWAENPDDRPTFPHLAAHLDALLTSAAAVVSIIERLLWLQYFSCYESIVVV